MDESFIPYGKHDVESEDIDAVVAALKSEWLTTGPLVKSFEEELSNVSGGLPVVAVSSGTAALHAALAGIGIGPGSEVVTGPLTFAAGAYLSLHLGATVRFADVSNDTLNLDPESVRDVMSSETSAIITTDYAGHPSDLDLLRDAAGTSGAVLIDDAAHSLGAFYKEEPVATFPDLTTYSFHPVKTITTGEGGAVVVKDPDTFERVRRFRDHGMARQGDDLLWSEEGPWHQEIQFLGLNYRLSDISCALGLSQLSRLQERVKRRAELVALYREMLADVDGIRLPAERGDATPAWHLFVVRILGGRRRAVYEKLRDRGIGVQVHYLPTYRHPVFIDAGYGSTVCPIADEAYSQVLSLPLYASLQANDVERVVDELKVALDS